MPAHICAHMPTRLHTPAHTEACAPPADAVRPCPQARSLQAVPRLVKLFNHANQEVQRHATGAMRNLIYDNADNKLALVEESGIFELLRTLREQDSELRKNVTGARSPPSPLSPPLPSAPSPLPSALAPPPHPPPWSPRWLCGQPPGPGACVPRLDGSPVTLQVPLSLSPAGLLGEARSAGQGPGRGLQPFPTIPRGGRGGRRVAPDPGLGPTCPRDPVEPVLQ